MAAMLTRALAKKSSCIPPQGLSRPNDFSSRGEVFKIAACFAAQNASWKLVWSDEFNGSALDGSKWSLETGGDGWGNNELETYTDGRNLTVTG
jgi:beta-glucanase (GH16 family)